MADKFEGSRLKVKRAQEHIADLNKFVESFRDTDFYEITRYPKNDAGYSRVFFRIKNSVPKDIAPIIGDAVHNLRSALDLLAYEAVTCVSGKEEPDVHFPFSRDRQGLITTRQYRAIEASAPQIAIFIADTIKPYEAANKSLWGLSKLNILDKHRLLIPTIQWVSIFLSHVDKEGVDTGETMALMVEGLGGVMRYDTLDDIKLHRYSQPKITILFGPETPFNGQSVLEVLLMRVVDVLKIITAFERAGFGPQS